MNREPYWARKFKESSRRSAGFGGFYTTGNDFSGEGDFAGADLSFGQDPTVMSPADPNAQNATLMTFAESATPPGATPGMNTATALTPEQNAILAAQQPVFDAEALQVQADADAAIGASGDAVLANDPSIQLSAWQQIQQAAMKSTGQLNDKGDGPGEGFWLSPVGIGVISAGAVTALIAIAKIKG